MTLKVKDVIRFNGEDAIVVQVSPFVLAKFRRGESRYVIMPTKTESNQILDGNKADENVK
jgi:hypothetical protein